MAVLQMVQVVVYSCVGGSGEVETWARDVAARG